MWRSMPSAEPREPPAEPHDEQDDLDELPPLDGDPKDGPDPEPTFEDLLEDEVGDATLDDSTAEDDAPDASELDVDESDTGWLDEAADAPDLDLGDVAVLDFGEESLGKVGAGAGAGADDAADDPADAEQDFGFGDAPERGDLDAGDEGPLDADEELREADLPALDADEEGDLDEASLVDAGFAADEPLGLPWAAEPWARVGAPVPIASATAVACALRGALVAGRAESGAAELSRVDLEGTCQSLTARGVDVAHVRSLAVEGDLVVALVEGGCATVSRDGGASFAPLAEAVVPAEAAIASGTVWLRMPAGGLVAVRSPATELHRCAVPGTVAAIANANASANQPSGVAALVVDDRGRPGSLVFGGSEGAGSLRREPIEGPEARSPALLAVRGEHFAYVARRGGVVRGLGRGPVKEFTWEGRVTALVFVDDTGTLVAATYSDSDDTTALVRLDEAGQPSVVARIGPARAEAETDGRVLAMAYDSDRAVVWVAGGFGVAAFAVG
jgi:hypothetical protein